MNARPLSVLVVDDSPFMRLALRRIIEAEGDLLVVGEAADGAAAIEQVRRLAPDAVAMDIEMPVMDGLEATRRLMAQPHPPAIIMVSSHTSEGSAMALAAMQAGAADWLNKDTGLGGLDLGHLDRELRARLRLWGSAHRAHAPPPAPTPQIAVPAEPRAFELVVVGASTGGPDALAGLLGGMGRLPVPVVLAQHMPDGMATDFARALARHSGLTVEVAVGGMVLQPGTVVVLPGGQDGALVRQAEGGLRLRLSPQTAAAHPSVDVLFTSAAMVARGVLGVVLTGMGRDGAAGAAALARRGYPVLVQDAASCVVAGMPNAVLALVPGAESATPAQIGGRLRALTQA
jgi:two-component system chemotaxis response regulator CheB